MKKRVIAAGLAAMMLAAPAFAMSSGGSSSSSKPDMSKAQKYADSGKFSKAVSELKKVAEFMKRFGGVKAVVEGHSDSTGAAAYNKQLSQRRADAVRNALIKEFGIDASRLSAIGYGEERPIADNSTKAGRQANRRVVAVMEAEVAK
mgnify:CR=1 FL=1